MHTVIETSTFLNDAASAGMSDEERAGIVLAVSENPLLGVLMPGTGGARKIRVAGRGKGKSGGYRVVTYYAAPDVPVFLLAVINKGERANLSKAEQNVLRSELSAIAEDYRAGLRRIWEARRR
ncbi:MAG: type II toxin-antitoxin system RelE/ParE family toxin [Alphaproteobacteria bacterium]|nr:type II toxin-antitoxin system RelE/ParE family toxin [Alphaproteobacteria bacterium]